MGDRKWGNSLYIEKKWAIKFDSNWGGVGWGGWGGAMVRSATMASIVPEGSLVGRWPDAEGRQLAWLYVGNMRPLRLTHPFAHVTINGAQIGTINSFNFFFQIWHQISVSNDCKINLTPIFWRPFSEKNFKKCTTKFQWLTFSGF